MRKLIAVVIALAFACQFADATPVTRNLSPLTVHRHRIDVYQATSLEAVTAGFEKKFELAATSQETNVQLACAGSWRLMPTACTDGFQDWYQWCLTGDGEGVYLNYVGSSAC